MSDESSEVILAPREIKDLVYRCCRVQGVDPGTADRLADNVLHAQIHRGPVLEAFVAVLEPSHDVSESEGADLTRLSIAADEVELAEAAVAAKGSATVTFEFAVPLLALSHSLWQAAERGTANVGVSATAHGVKQISGIEFVSEGLDQPTQAAASERHLKAHQQGLPVAASSLGRLESLAARFLVAEATLDTIAP